MKNVRWVNEDQCPAYDPKLWSTVPTYAMDKIEQMKRGHAKKEVFYPELLQTLRETHRPGDSILDVGCCGGHYWETVRAVLGDVDYTGIDITPEYIEVARARYPEKTWIRGDVRNLPLPDGSIDHSLCLFVLMHLDEKGVALAIDELTRVTRRQILLSAYFSPARMFGTQGEFIYNIVSKSELERPGWEVQVTEGTADEVPRTVVLEATNPDGTKETVEMHLFSYTRLVKK